VRLALAQVDSRLGDLEANIARAGDVLREARDARADLVVFPELQLSGYSLGAVERDVSCSVDELTPLARCAGEAAAVLGFAERDGATRYNSAAYFERGSLVHVHRKLHLVDYPPFSEDAVFSAGQALRAFDAGVGRLAILICNDVWQPVPPFLAVQDGADLLLVPSCSSTAVAEAEEYWRDLTRFYARILQCYVVFANRVGTEDGGLTFWGGSHVVDPWGEVVAEAARFEEQLLVVEIDLAAVDARRAELRIVEEPRLDLLRSELERLEKAAARSRLEQLQGGLRNAR
jgi:predicted amidohydrolase